MTESYDEGIFLFFMFGNISESVAFFLFACFNFYAWESKKKRKHTKKKEKPQWKGPPREKCAKGSKGWRCRWRRQERRVIRCMRNCRKGLKNKTNAFVKCAKQCNKAFS